MPVFTPLVKVSATAHLGHSIDAGAVRRGKDGPFE